MPAKSKKNEGNPWDARKGERTYHNFLRYLEMEPPRNLNVLARRIGVNAPALRVASMRWEWAERARAFDTFRASRAHEVMFQHAEERARAVLTACDIMIKIGIRRFNKAYEEEELVPIKEATTLVSEAQRMAGIAEAPRQTVGAEEPEDDLPDELTMEQIREMLSRENVQ